MAKLTKAQRKAHAEAEALLKKETLTADDKEFIFRNWHEGATHNNGERAAHFTPFDFAGDFTLDLGRSGKFIDLCAGIGVLSFLLSERAKASREEIELTCIEINPEYVEIGKRLLPEARWICADVFDWQSLDLGHYDYAFANPPFGKAARTGNGPRYRGPYFEYHLIDIASQLANYGAFIVLQESAGFRYSGARYYERIKGGRADEFSRQIKTYLNAGVGIDTTVFRGDWKDVSPLCEVLCVDFNDLDDEQPTTPASESFAPISAPQVAAQQLNLF